MPLLFDKSKILDSKDTNGMTFGKALDARH